MSVQDVSLERPGKTVKRNITPTRRTRLTTHEPLKSVRVRLRRGTYSSIARLGLGRILIVLV